MPVLFKLTLNCHLFQSFCNDMFFRIKRVLGSLLNYFLIWTCCFSNVPSFTACPDTSPPSRRERSFWCGETVPKTPTWTRNYGKYGRLLTLTYYRCEVHFSASVFLHDYHDFFYLLGCILIIRCHKSFKTNLPDSYNTAGRRFISSFPLKGVMY